MQLTQAHKTILRKLSDGKFHSGTELAADLNLSRTGVWKQLQGLDVLGLKPIAISGKGYRLEHPIELLDQSVILANIGDIARHSINLIEIFDQIDSTNAYLLKKSTESAPSGTICLAEQQTSGKGRRGRQWVSPFGHNVYLSVLWRFQGSPLALSGLSLAVGVAVIRSLKHHYPHEFQLKWPNDIYCDNKKLGGILIEVSGETEGPSVAVVGIGLNRWLSEPDATDIARAWTDLSKITGEIPSNRNALIGTLLDQLLAVLAEYEERGIGAYVNEWRQYDCLKDKSATLYVGQRTFQGTVKGIDDHGLLLMTEGGGTLRTFASGEVTFNQSP